MYQLLIPVGVWGQSQNCYPREVVTATNQPQIKENTMYQLLIPAMLLVGGIYSLVRNIRFLKDQAKLEKHLKVNPAGKRWVKYFGQEKALHLSRKYFVPIGIVVALAMIWIGGLTLFKMLAHYI